MFRTGVFPGNCAYHFPMISVIHAEWWYIH